MPKHKPIKFESLDHGVVKQIKKIISENKTAKSCFKRNIGDYGHTEELLLWAPWLRDY